MVDLVRKHPGVAIPVVLPRLMQKEEEWYVYEFTPLPHVSLLGMLWCISAKCLPSSLM